MPGITTTNFRDSNNVDLGKKLVTKDYLLSVYGTILENSPASGLVVTPELWTWGGGGNGQLGNNAVTNRSTPVTTFAGGTNWKQVAGGASQNTAAIKTDGTLWVWGRNNFGQLGINNTDQKNAPVTTFAGGTTWKSVVCGGYHTVAIKTDGSLWTWGRNSDFGQLGVNDITNRLTPITTFSGGTNWKQVSAQDGNHTTAIKTDGSLWVWGAGTNGQLGDNTIITRSTPVTTFAGGNNWKQVFGARSHTVAIQSNDYI
jgi:alpha-tubulin suppressor-like RCC1 family protein